MKPLNPLIQYFLDMQALLGDYNKVIIPKDFHQQVDLIKETMKCDVSGIASSMLDYAISCASQVKYTVETNNDRLSKVLNRWLERVNFHLRGKIIVGVEGLAKQYFHERWFNSSFIVVRTIWETIDGFKLPTKIWLVDGGSVKIETDEETAIIGDETYKLVIGKNKEIKLPSKENERLFVQKPYDPVGIDYPTPYLIRRGIIKNIKILDKLIEKGDKLVAQALEYMMLFKKGTEGLALSGKNEFIYDNKDLKEISENFKNFLKDKDYKGGVPTYFTNFDTDIEHIIPDYEKALKGALSSPIEKRILAGLGVVEIFEGIGTRRREAILNPRPFIKEVRQGVKDFCSLLKDILETIREENKHKRKYISEGRILKVITTPISDFVTEDVRRHLRNMYDRGNLSKQTYVEVCGDDNIDFDLERKRRIREINTGDEELFEPHVIQAKPLQTIETTENSKGDEIEVPETHQGTDKVDFVASSLELSVYKTINDLPDSIKNVLPIKARKIWMEAFNNAFEQYEDEETAFKVAWVAVKKAGYKKDKKTKKWKLSKKNKKE